MYDIKITKAEVLKEKPVDESKLGLVSFFQIICCALIITRV